VPGHLKLTQLPAALLVNVNAVTLKTGLRRLTQKQESPLSRLPVHHNRAASLVFPTGSKPDHAASSDVAEVR
jgi:hypothetical protein